MALLLLGFPWNFYGSCIFCIMILFGIICLADRTISNKLNFLGLRPFARIRWIKSMFHLGFFIRYSIQLFHFFGFTYGFFVFLLASAWLFVDNAEVVI